MHNTSLKPKLRFKDFVSDWSYDKFGNGVESYVEKVPAETTLPVYTSSRTGLYAQEDYFANRKVTNEGEYGVVPNGYFVYRHMSDDLTFMFNLNDTNNKIAVSKEYPVFKAKVWDSRFIRYKLNYSVDFKKFAATQKLGGTRTRLYFKSLCEWNVLLPSVLEQQRIADFLSAVDKKISLLKNKEQLLSQYKKGVMQQLFSQQSRFKDENGQAFPDWQPKVIGDFMAESKVKGCTGDIAKKITVKLWGKGVFEKNGKILGSENTQYYKRKAGQFLYSKLDFLNCAFGIVPDFLDGFETTVDLPCFDIDNGINKYLILELIKQKNFYKKYGDMADGSRKAKRIHATDFLSFPIKLPCEKEQDKMAEFLSALDKKIELVNQQIEHTQIFKKGLLQKMFV